jgi:hypothetical protein
MPGLHLGTRGWGLCWYPLPNVGGTTHVGTNAGTWLLADHYLVSLHYSHGVIRRWAPGLRCLVFHESMRNPTIAYGGSGAPRSDRYVQGVVQLFYGPELLALVMC